MNMTTETSRNMLEAVFGPPISPNLIEELEEVFPPTTPNPDDSIQQIMYRAGQRSVVNYLIQRKEEES